MIKASMKPMLIGAIFLSMGVLSNPAQAVTFAFDANGGSGTGNVLYADDDDFGLVLISNNDDISGIYTTFTSLAETALTVLGSYSYLTSDVDGSSFDPLGYMVGSVYTVLTVPLDKPAIQTGNYSFSVAAGEKYGFYVLSTDGTLGSGIGTVTGTVTSVDVAPIPLPAGGLLIVSALSFLGFLGRRKKAI